MNGCSVGVGRGAGRDNEWGVVKVSRRPVRRRNRYATYSPSGHRKDFLVASVVFKSGKVGPYAHLEFIWPTKALARTKDRKLHTKMEQYKALRPIKAIAALLLVVILRLGEEREREVGERRVSKTSQNRRFEIAWGYATSFLFGRIK